MAFSEQPKKSRNNKNQILMIYKLLLVIATIFTLSSCQQDELVNNESPNAAQESPTTRAASLTQQQWWKIQTDMLGLRSESVPNQILAAASYAMDMGVSGFVRDIPASWMSTLNNTIAQIMAFENSQSRYLLIVKPSHGTTVDYPGCFPKCSSKSTTITASTLIGNKTKAELVDWVINNIK